MKKNQRGLIKEAFETIKHDYHGLAIQIDMIKFIFAYRKGVIRHKDFLYVSEITEKYFTNLPSIYDFIAKVIRLTVEPKYLGTIIFDSFDELINQIEKGKTKVKISADIEKIILSAKDNFSKINDIRDFIIHNGKQIRVTTNSKGYLIGNFSKDYTDFEDHVSIFEFLAEITNQMFFFGESIGVQIQKEYSRIYGAFPCYYVALEGVCIPAFIDFLGWIEEDDSNY